MRISSFFIPLAYRSSGQVPLKLLQGPALCFRYLAPEVDQRDQGEGTKQEEHPHSPDRVLDREETRQVRSWSRTVITERRRYTGPTTASGDTEAGPAADILPTVAVRSPPPTPSETPARSANATPAHWPRGSSGGRRSGGKYPENADGPTKL
jgi:hypothetical protein